MSTWSDWSIFPITFTSGLEALLYFSEQDQINLQIFIENEEGNPERSILSEEEKDVLYRKAKSYGIDIKDNSLRSEIEFKIEFIEKYFKKVYPHLITVEESMEENEIELKEVEEDVDGVPIEFGVPNNDMVDDDIDGVPLILETNKPVSNWQSYEQEDVDGVPLEEDIDGVEIDGNPLDGEELDGEPLDGEPLRDDNVDGVALDADLDGQPIDEDIDGVPFDS